MSGYDCELTGQLSGLPSLTELVLRTERMTQAPVLPDLPELQLIDLDGNTITTLASGWLARAPSVRRVYLGHNKVSTVAADAVVLADIEVLDLSANLIQTVQVDAIQGSWTGDKRFLLETHSNLSLLVI